MRSIAGLPSGERRGCYKPTRVAPQHLDKFDLTRQGPVVGSDVAGRACEKSRGRGVAGGVIRAAKIVIDRFRDSDDLEVVAEGFPTLRDPRSRAHRAVAAGIEKIADTAPLKNRE